MLDVSIYAANFYRALGTKIWRGTKNSKASWILSYMLTLDQGSFITDNVLFVKEAIDRSLMMIRHTIVGDCSFMGNGAYVLDSSINMISVQSLAHSKIRIRSGRFFWKICHCCCECVDKIPNDQLVNL